MSKLRIKNKKLQDDLTKLEDKFFNEKQDWLNEKQSLLDRIDDFQQQQSLPLNVDRQFDEIKQCIEDIKNEVKKEKPSKVDWVTDFVSTFRDFAKNNFSSIVSIILIVLVCSFMFVFYVFLENMTNRGIDKMIPTSTEVETQKKTFEMMQMVDSITQEKEQAIVDSIEKDEVIKKQNEIIQKQMDMIESKDKKIEEQQQMIDSLLEQVNNSVEGKK